MRRRVLLFALALLFLAVFYVLTRIEGETASGPDAFLTTSVEGLGRVRVEVLNAGGEPGMARLATERLRARGSDVVYFGNAPDFGADSTLVLDRVGWAEAAEVVSRVLQTGEVESQPDSTRFVDVTVLLGRDWKPDASGSVVEGEMESGGRDGLLERLKFWR